LLLGGTNLATAQPATGVAHKRKSNSVVERWAMPAAGSFLGSKGVHLPEFRSLDTTPSALIPITGKLILYIIQQIRKPVVIAKQRYNEILPLK
jgi:hypothetical protein